MRTETVRDIRNFFGGLLWAYGLFTMVSFFVLTWLWNHSAPTAPDALHFYRHNEHSWITYWTAYQATCASLLFATSLLTAALGWFIKPKANVKTRITRFAVSTIVSRDDPRLVSRWGYVAGVVCGAAMILLIGPILVRAVNTVVVMPF